MACIGDPSIVNRGERLEYICKGIAKRAVKGELELTLSMLKKKALGMFVGGAASEVQ